jgi:hypothetical protein
MSRITAPVGEVITPITRGRNGRRRLRAEANSPSASSRALVFSSRASSALARDLHPVDHDLVVRAARIGRQLAGRDNLDPVLDTKIQPPGIAAPHHPVEPGVLVLEAQVHMPRGRALHARKLAAHAHEAKAILDRALEQGRNLGNRQGRGVVASAFAR